MSDKEAKLEKAYLEALRNYQKYLSNVCFKKLNKKFNNLPNKLKIKYAKEFNHLKKIKNDRLKMTDFDSLKHWNKPEKEKKNYFEEHSNLLTSNRENIEFIFDKEAKQSNLKIGSKDPISLIIEDIHNFCEKMNWKFLETPNVVKTEENFDLLNIPKDHPSRSENDCFYLDVNPNWMLRTHTTTMTLQQIKDFAKNKKNRYVYTIGNVYRDDTDDQTHLPQFKQFDACLIDNDLSLANLKWILIKFCEYIFGAKIKTKFRHNFFPFTEPSLELDISCLFCRQKGCSVCKKSGWIELLGTGIIRNEVLKNCNINEDITVLAFGIGIERLAMLKYKIDDIRSLYKEGWVKKVS